MRRGSAPPAELEGLPSVRSNEFEDGRQRLDSFERARAEHEVDLGESGLAERAERVRDLFRRAGDRGRPPAGGLSRVDGDARAAADGRRVAADLIADRVECREPGAQLVDVRPLLCVPAPDVGVEGRMTLALRPVATDEQRDRVRARADRLLGQVAGGVVLGLRSPRARSG